MSNLIVDLRARKVVDTRAEMSIEVDVIAECSDGRASAPLGAPGSRGAFEPPAYPEGSVDAALETVDTLLKPRLAGQDVLEQERADAMPREIDVTRKYARIGGNTAMVVSVAVAKAAANGLVDPLYRHLWRSEGLGTMWPWICSASTVSLMDGGPGSWAGILRRRRRPQSLTLCTGSGGGRQGACDEGPGVEGWSARSEAYA